MKVEIEKFLEKKGYDPKDIFKQIAITNVAILMQQYADEVNKDDAVKFHLYIIGNFKDDPGIDPDILRMYELHFDEWKSKQEQL